ncbi:uncharacterized protein K452DRAFT_260871 [Neofusicoccum parvum]|uniref:Uncharacterized protein K452DRAFT_260871 n=1 Tax=Neofusicoccum parvum TaxID=310453 RepID=A0ACB5SQW3_9PEZI|nr:uncharacterized protein K452DRAFT_260871 [Neofusicoccum parvum]
MKLTDDPLQGAEHHIPRQYAPGELERFWRIAATPQPSSPAQIRAAVAIDCEMGEAATGDSELIRVTMVDYFTSEVLVDSLVFPAVAMRDLRTRFSGVTWAALHDARRRRACLLGRDSARRAVWAFVGPDTVVVGHSANHDLLALRWAHPTVVDTVHLEALRPPDPPAAKGEGPGEEATAPVESNGGSDVLCH